MQMTSEPMRDPVTDHLLTPRNSALVVIDYQPLQLQVMTSMDREALVDNIVSVARLARTYNLPVVLSTVNAANGQGNTLPEIKAALPDTPEIDRTTMNAWEDVEFRRAVEATGRKKLVMTALWTEVCLAFPTLDALRSGFDVYPVVDAVGGTSEAAHETALERVVSAGARPVSWVGLLCELQRDWGRSNTALDFREILFGPAPHVAITAEAA
jgi:nicotinamidase-related amidase